VSTSSALLDVLAARVSAQLTADSSALLSQKEWTCPYIDPALPGAESRVCDDGFVWLLPRSCTPFSATSKRAKPHHPSQLNCVYHDRANDLVKWPVFDKETNSAPPVLVDVANAPADRPQPLVSALHPFVSSSKSFLEHRRRFINGSMAQWNAQHYANLEYVIVYHRDDQETAAIVREVARIFESSTRRITQVTVDDATMALGEVRNIAINASSGTYVATWDDDNMVHPLRIAAQVLALQCSGKSVVMLDQFIEHWTKRVGGVSFVSHRGPKIQTLLAERDSMIGCYDPALSRGEDTRCLKRFKFTHPAHRMLVLMHAPWLYIYVSHGNNLTPTKVFGRHMIDSPAKGNIFNISEVAHLRLANSLAKLAIDPHAGLDVSAWPSMRELNFSHCMKSAERDAYFTSQANE
jgi:hypothetical protein